VGPTVFSVLFFSLFYQGQAVFLDRVWNYQLRVPPTLSESECVSFPLFVVRSGISFTGSGL